MAQSGIPVKDVQAVAAAFLGMLKDPEGRQVLASVSDLVKLPSDAGFVASDGSEYDAYRKFHATAPAQLR